MGENQLSTKKKETDKPGRVESESNPRYFTVLWLWQIIEPLTEKTWDEFELF